MSDHSEEQDEEPVKAGDRVNWHDYHGVLVLKISEDGESARIEFRPRSDPNYKQRYWIPLTELVSMK